MVLVVKQLHDEPTAESSIRFKIVEFGKRSFLEQNRIRGGNDLDAEKPSIDPPSRLAWKYNSIEETLVYIFIS